MRGVTFFSSSRNKNSNYSCTFVLSIRGKKWLSKDYNGISVIQARPETMTIISLRRSITVSRIIIIVVIIPTCIYYNIYVYHIYESLLFVQLSTVWHNKSTLLLFNTRYRTRNLLLMELKKKTNFKFTPQCRCFSQ